MADAQQHHAPGGHYSGRNKIPTINKFLENLDKDKKERDRQIEEQQKAGQRPARSSKQQQQQQSQQGQGDAVDHQVQDYTLKGSEKTVKDPTTGRQVVISDVNKETMNNVENPIVRVAPADTEH